ncbi:MAG: glycosyltransferase [Chloroflexi bacterium]|nr:glycosyltransferase [Chloroflexota bacterium]
MNDIKASIVILAWNGRRYLQDCLEAVLRQEFASFEVIVVDNGSTDGSADLVSERFPKVKLIRNESNLGYSAGNNVGIRAASGDVLVFLNQDTIVQPEWLATLVNTSQDSRVGVVGCKILDFAGTTLLHCGGYLEMPLLLGRHIGAGELDQGQYDTPSEVEYVTGAALAMRRDVLERIGVWDEQFCPAFYEDVDMCWRARAAGLAVRYEPKSVLLHDESSSTRANPLLGHYLHCRARLSFLIKHYPVDWILQQFVPAERTRLENVDFAETRADHRALVEARALCSHVRHPRERAQLCLALDMLRQIAVRRQHSTEVTITPAPEGWGDAELITPMPPTLQETDILSAPGQDVASSPKSRKVEALLGRLQAISRLHEHPFKSDVPLVGPMIAAVRRAWNSVSTQWYVRPLINQQSLYNAAAVETLLAVDADHNGLMEQIARIVKQTKDTHYGLSYVWDMDSVVAKLVEQQALLQQQVNALRVQLDRIQTEKSREQEK